MKMIESYSGELADLSSTDSAYSKYLRLADILSDVQRGEASTSGAIQNLLELSEAYPQDIRIQAIAAIVGSENKWDGASHYTRASEAVLRFIRCAEETPELFGADSATVIIGFRNTAADMLMNIKEYEKARDVLKGTLEKSSADKSARQMLARCYMELGEGEESRKLAKEISDADPNDVSALWTLCVCSLKAGDSREAIAAAGKLADAVKNGRLEGDSLLFNCVSELTISDSSAHYTHSIYTDKPDDENVKLIEQNELLNHYCAAVYCEKQKRDYEQALTHVNKALEAQPQSSRLLYLKGLIYFNMEEFEKSEESLLKADALDPNDLSIMYALANTYDGMEEYKKAYDYCERLIAKYPNGADHDEDVYGAMPHAQMLMNSLKSYVEEGN
jgi:tetratricopeptide (TPR) repeat protein